MSKDVRVFYWLLVIGYWKVNGQ